MAPPRLSICARDWPTASRSAARKPSEEWAICSYNCNPTVRTAVHFSYFLTPSYYSSGVVRGHKSSPHPPPGTCMLTIGILSTIGFGTTNHTQCSPTNVGCCELIHTLALSARRRHRNVPLTGSAPSCWCWVNADDALTRVVLEGGAV